MPSYERNLIDYVPPYYSELLESIEILSAENAEIAKLNADIDDLLAQFNVSTATWGLIEWERIAGITTDQEKTLGERRSVVIARLRGAGVVTKAHIKSVSEAFLGGEIEVSEKYAEYIITIKFINMYGVPSNLVDLTDILREIIPAHLGIEYEFKFVTYEMFRKTGRTYDAISASGRTYDDLKTGGL